MSRTQKILAFVAAARTPVDFDAICKAAGIKGSTLRPTVSTQLGQLVKAGKLKRTGEARNYRYTKTSITLVDRRKVDASGNARNRTQVARNRAPAKKTAAAKVVRQVAAKLERAAHKPKPHQHISIPPPAPHITQAPRPAGRRETVEEFLARGGKIQKLRAGEWSKPLHTDDYHEQSRKTWARRAAESTNPLDFDTD